VVDVRDYGTTKTAYQNSCFVQGTKVATTQGDVPIEELAEGMQVLTRTGPEEYGIVSDEDVVTPLSVPILVGFSTFHISFHSPYYVTDGGRR